MTSQQKTLAGNVFLLLTTGTMVCFWFWRYTDWFEELGAVLTLSGVLSWLAAILKVVPDEKTKAFQATLFEAVFESPSSRKWIMTFFAVVAIGSFCFATVQLEPLQESVDRAVLAYSARANTNAAAVDRTPSARIAEEDFETLKPSGRVRLVLPVWWGMQNRFIVKVSGYPDMLIKLRPWQRLDLTVPNSLCRPVVLLRPTARLINNARQEPWTLIVRDVDSNVEAQMLFDGHAVWVGCDANVQLPEAMQHLWETDINDVLKPFFLYPQAFSNAFPELKQGEKFAVQLRTGPGLLQPAISFEVAPAPPRQGFFPQVVKIDSSN
jgi:hypothetical protein